MVNNSNIVNAMVKYHFSDGIHTLPCKVNKQTHEVFDISGKTQLVKELVEDDDFSFDSDEEATLFEVYEDLDYAEVEVDGKLYPFQILEMIDEALQDGGMNPIEEYSAVEKSGDYWEAVDGMSLTQCIRSWRWWELKNSIEHNRTAILRHLNDPDSIDDEYRISDVVFAADNTTVSVLWEGNSKDGVSGTVTLAVNGKTVYATKSTKVFCNHWVIPYNGAEYHVLVDVLPKKTVLEETIYVSKPYAERIKKYLRGAEAQGDGSSLSKTAKFSDGFEMDIRCCGGKDDSWTEAILYDDTGREVTVTEPCDGFTGCWELKDEDANTVYRAHVMTKPNLN